MCYMHVYVACYMHMCVFWHMYKFFIHIHTFLFQFFFCSAGNQTLDLVHDRQAQYTELHSHSTYIHFLSLFVKKEKKHAYGNKHA
jgi:hypothetical protein